jgi:hypothetical protein
MASPCAQAIGFGLGGQATFNMQHGFVEALVRGFRSGFLTDENYHHLSQCDNLEVSFDDTRFCIIH